MKEINVLVTGAAGQIGYALLPRLASGETFGSDVIVNLRLVEIPQVVEKLNGTIMELEDCGFNTLGSSIVNRQAHVLFGLSILFIFNCSFNYI